MASKRNRGLLLVACLVTVAAMLVVTRPLDVPSTVVHHPMSAGSVGGEPRGDKLSLEGGAGGHERAGVAAKPVLPGNRSIGGRVSYGFEHGPPVHGAFVELLDHETSSVDDDAVRVASVQTDSDGRFFFGSVPEASQFLLVVESRGYRSELTAARPGDEDIALVLVEDVGRSSIGGRVVDEHGNPISSFQIRVAGDGVAPVTERFSGALSGAFSIELSQGPDQTEVAIEVSSPEYRVDGVVVELLRGRHEDVGPIRLQELGHGVVAGVAVDAETREPIAGAQVTPMSWVSVSSGRVWREESAITTDDEGRFVIDALVGDGVAALTADADGYAPGYVTLAAEAPEALLEVALERGRALRGRVVDSEGLPVKGAVIRCGRDGFTSPQKVAFDTFGFRFSTTDASGHFVFERMATGRYRVERFVLEGDAEQALDMQHVVLDQFEPKPIEFVVGDGVVVSARLDLGKGVAQASEVACFLETETGQVVAAAMVDPRSPLARIPDVMPGEYRFCVYPTGFREQRFEVACVVEAVPVDLGELRLDGPPSVNTDGTEK